MRETLTNLLDALALLLLAAGLGFQATGWMTVVFSGSHGFNIAATGVGLTIAGLVVFTGSWLASRPAQMSEGGDQ